MDLFGSLVLKMSEATFRPVFLKVGHLPVVSHGRGRHTYQSPPSLSRACSFLTGPHRRVGVAVGVVRGSLPSTM